jgi:hypothetical protein
MSKRHFSSKPDRNGVRWTRSSVSNKAFTHVAVLHTEAREVRGHHFRAGSRVSFASRLDLAQRAFKTGDGRSVEVLEVEELAKPLPSRDGRAL